MFINLFFNTFKQGLIKLFFSYGKQKYIFIRELLFIFLFIMNKKLYYFFRKSIITIQVYIHHFHHHHHHFHQLLNFLKDFLSIVQYFMVVN